jgi:hypothetical protein
MHCSFNFEQSGACMIISKPVGDDKSQDDPRFVVGVFLFVYSEAIWAVLKVH